MPSFSVSVAAGIAILAAAVYKLIIYPAFLSPLSKIPAANWTVHFTSLWINYIRYTNVENATVYELHKKKGPIVRMGPAELSVNCYEGGLKTIYTGGFPKTEFYINRFMNYGDIKNMFCFIDSKTHSTRKRMLSNVYSKSVVLASPTARATSKAILYDRLLPIFQISSDSKNAIEVHSLDYAYAMDTFMAYQFGLDIGTNFIQDVEKRKRYLHLFFSRRPYLFWTTELPKFTAWMHRLGVRLVPQWVDDATVALETWNLDVCDKAEALLSSPAAGSTPAISYPAIYAVERAKFQEADLKLPPQMTAKDPRQTYPRRLDIASDMYDHNAAAHETSGDTLTWLYYEMSLRPALQKQLRDELLTLAPPILFPTPSADFELPDPKKVDALPLLDAILQETLRRWVSVPGGQPRVTPGVCSLAGYDGIPGGVRVQSAAYTLHRNPEVFPDPEAWKPERWLDASVDELNEMKRWFWAFGSGGRMCIGNNIAIHSMKHAIAGIYTNFTTTVVDAEGIEQDDGFTAGPKGNKLWLQFHHV
ncbi:cytochrome P450 [Lophium mytilinum]|uniref:Cytochrome P450 n=1 Tax=Lophium mytilinum TaxID=390894 RepID=A0A6A6QFB4_9PEZI|nr:cytochrome P450 [Lophium mytilinum]